jgi:phosphonate transport system substrate-binding protein
MGQKLGISTEFIYDIPWQERERLLDSGEIDVAWMCGLPYIRKRDDRATDIELLAAPIMKHPRYAEMPVYYSDIVVRADSHFHCFDDLRGTIWAYNERGSHSGFNLIRYHLATRGVAASYFSQVVESGSHQDSLQLILEGYIDASAIDSTVLEMELVRDPEIARKIRIIGVLGPSPAPPWVVHRSVPDNLRDALRREFLAMHKDLEGRAILKTAGILRFGEISDKDYNPIREMNRIAEAVEW